MTALDWTIVVIYMAGLMAMSVFLGRGQENEADYYVGGRSLPWWAIGISTMATQTSVNSFISIPAFVALKPGGGLNFLGYELALPIAMIAIMVLLIPLFRKLNLISVYEYLERRFDVRVRLLVSGIFLFSRALATGVTVYATAIVLLVCVGGDLGGLGPSGTLAAIIIFVGVFTIIYDTIGGMKAVVWSDVIQMGVLIVGLVACIVYAFDAAGGVGAAFTEFPTERWEALQFELGFTEGSETPFWAFLFGGLFLYASYYGTDQSQTQRELSAPTLADTKRSLVFNGIARFPLIATYMLLGLSLAAAVVHLPDLQARLSEGGVDHLVPHFIVSVLPAGVRALLIAALLAAAMSSLDSTLNSMSASTMQDFIQRFNKLEHGKALTIGKLTTVVWGIIITGCSLLVASNAGAKAVVELVNQISSAFFGPILAAFVLGVLTKVGGKSALAGIAGGVATNVFLWQVHPEVHFVWWNFTGFAGAVILALGLQIALKDVDTPSPELQVQVDGLLHREREWLGTYAVLVGYFCFILAVGALLTWISGGESGAETFASFWP